jgi:acyl-CoA thioester hydrolase
MKLDFPAEPYTLDISVASADVDGLGHVNNAVYVAWMERCAWSHSESLGIGLDQYQALDRAMAVSRHEIDYLAPAHNGDELRLATWIIASDQKLRMTRRFQLLRPSDETTLLRAQTTFVCIELSSGRPRRMPMAFLSGYGKALIEV